MTAVYLIAVMLITAMSILASVIVLAIHHRDPTARVPTSVARIVFGRLSPVFCKVTLHAEELDDLEDLENHMRHRSTAEVTTLTVRPTTADEGDVEVELKSDEDSADRNGSEKAAADGGNIHLQTLRSDFNTMLGELKGHLQGITDALHHKRRRELIRHEWRMLAKVIDRVLLAFFCTVLLLLDGIIFILPLL